MASPLKAVRNLLKLREEANDEVLLKPETVAGGLEAVRDLLGSGLPAKEAFYDDASARRTLEALAAFYRQYGRPALAAGDRNAGAGDRLYRDDISRLAEGLIDVAERVALAASLRKARREAGYSIRELARFAGVHHSYLSRVERGAVPRPSDAIMGRLAAPLGLPGAPTAPEGVADLASLGLHRAAVRSLLKIVRGLPDEHLELLVAQARAMLDQTRRKRGAAADAGGPGHPRKLAPRQGAAGDRG